MIIPSPLKPLVRTTFHAAISSIVSLARKKYRYVFVLGHMRSGSSLLSHILMSHPTMTGFGEAHLAYRIPDDFSALVAATCRYTHRAFISEPVLVDQVNHNHYLTDEAVAALDSAVIITRNREQAVPSIIKRMKWSVAESNRYYDERIGMLANYKRVLGSRASRVTYEELTTHPDSTLSDLTNFLGLEQPLSTEYQTNRMTSHRGDKSPMIHSGKIQRRAG